MKKEKPQNPYAFPIQTDMVVTFGMTLRDYFAAKAMQGWLSNPQTTIKTKKELAEEAYEVADAMLKQRELSHIPH